MPRDDGILRQGSKGNAVKTLQQNLNKVMGLKLAVDGESVRPPSRRSKPSSAGTG